jgi:hypothetical protein
MKASDSCKIQVYNIQSTNFDRFGLRRSIKKTIKVGKIGRQLSDDRGQSTDDRGQILEVGSGTRRRPIGRDYAAAKDAEVGKIGR